VNIDEAVDGNGHVAPSTVPALCGPGSGDHGHGKGDEGRCDDGKK
jgi:hypothetical protein